MKRHAVGETVRGAVALEILVPDVRVIREAASSGRVTAVAIILIAACARILWATGLSDA